MVTTRSSASPILGKASASGTSACARRNARIASAKSTTKRRKRAESVALHLNDTSFELLRTIFRSHQWRGLNVSSSEGQLLLDMAKRNLVVPHQSDGHELASWRLTKLGEMVLRRRFKPENLTR